MYSEQIEQLIKSVIADGVITEKERAVLHKRAAAEGIDEDEIDVYVDGLVAQMKSDTPKMEVPKSVNIDFKHVNKTLGNFRGYAYYVGQKWYQVNSIPKGLVKKIYLNFFKEIIKDGDTKIGIAAAYVYKDEAFGHEPQLTLKTNTNSLELSGKYSHLDVPANIVINNHEHSTSLYYLDEEMLKILCDAKQISFSMLYTYGNEILVDIKNIIVSGLATYAQVFYRSIVDNNAYPNAIIGNAKYEDGTSANNEIAEEKSINIDDAIVARIFRTEVKKFETIKPCPSCFKQYKAINGIIVTHIEDKLEPSEHVWPEYNLKSLTNDKGVTCFYLCVRTDYQMEELEATINMNSHQLRHISDPDSKKDEVFFFNFYEIETSLLKDMLYTKLDISLKDDEDDKEMEKIPKTWKQAFEYLTDPAKLDNWRKENPDGAGLFSKFKKLF